MLMAMYNNVGEKIQMGDDRCSKQCHTAK